MIFAPPFPFKNTAAALAWYRSTFAGLTGCRTSPSTTTVGKVTMAAGQTISNKKVKGQVRAAPTARLIDCIVDATRTAADRSAISGPAAPDFIAQNLTLAGSLDQQIALAGTSGHPATLAFIRASDAGADFAKPGSFTNWQNIWFTRGGLSAGSHSDMFQPVANATSIKIDTVFSDMANDVPGTHSNSALFFQNGVHDVTVRRLVIIGGNYAIHADCIRLDIDEVYYFAGSARFGLSSAWRPDARIGPNIFDAVTGARISIHAR